MITPRYSQCLLVSCLLAVTPLLHVRANDSTVADFIPGVENLSAESLILLAQTTDDLDLIDTRLIEDRKMGFIERSISLPDVETSCETLGRLFPDRSRSLVFYCNGMNCSRSIVALMIAVDCKYRNLYWFKGGFLEWRQKDYPYLLD